MNAFTIIILIVVGFFVIGIPNFMQCVTIIADGWSGKEFEWTRGCDDARDYLWNIIFLLSLPGAILGIIIGIVTFQWLNWK